MAVIGPFEFQIRYIGLSTDTKPTVNVPLGSGLYEADTGLVYLFDGTTWYRAEEIKNV